MCTYEGRICHFSREGMEGCWFPCVSGNSHCHSLRVPLYLSRFWKIVLGVAAYGHSFHVDTSAAVDSNGTLALYPPFDKAQQPAGDSDVPGAEPSAKRTSLKPHMIVLTAFIALYLQALTHAEILLGLVVHSTSRVWLPEDS